MKISKKTVVALCIIVPILELVLWHNQKPNFSKYHSYAVETKSGYIPLTDEQFQQIAQSYISEETLHYVWFGHNGPAGNKLILFKSDDMSGNCVTMYTGGLGAVSSLYLGNRCFEFDSSKPINIAEKIIAEAFKQYESEQEL